MKIIDLYVMKTQFKALFSAALLATGMAFTATSAQAAEREFLNVSYDATREFYEELVEPGLLPIELFKHVKYVYIGSHKELVPPSPGFPIDQFRYAEIYELRPDSDEQKEAIENLIYENEITFATPDEIRSGSNSDGLTILPHTFKILPR